MDQLKPLVRGLAHIGIRVRELDRSRDFYEQLGFRHLWGPAGPEPVVAMLHPSGLELNLIVNSSDESAKNVLMDLEEKHAGITHIALKITDVTNVENALAKAGIAITGKRGTAAIFVRDPDRNVIELATD